MQTKPPVPTMTSASLIPSLEGVAQGNPLLSPELGDDITARPMKLPDFVNVPLANPQLVARWIFTDKRRYAQARAQGWRNATKIDIKPGYAALTPFQEDGGTKYINGDVILMVIDRRIYLGALRYKHEVAAALSDSAVQRTISAQKAAAAAGPEVAAINKAMMDRGSKPVMTVFTPGAADLHETPLGTAKGAAEVSRLGTAGRDEGTGADLASELNKIRQADSTST